MRLLPFGAYCVPEGPLEGPSEILHVDDALLSPSVAQRAPSMSKMPPVLYIQSSMRSPSVQSLAPPTPSPTSVSPPKAPRSPLAQGLWGNASFAESALHTRPQTQGSFQDPVQDPRSGLQEALPRHPYPTAPEKARRCEETPSGSLHPTEPSECPVGNRISLSYPAAAASWGPRGQRRKHLFRSFDSAGVPWCPSCQARSPLCCSHPPGAPCILHFLTGTPVFQPGSPSGSPPTSQMEASVSTSTTPDDFVDPSDICGAHRSLSCERRVSNDYPQGLPPSPSSALHGHSPREKTRQEPSSTQEFQPSPSPSRESGGCFFSSKEPKKPIFVNKLRRLRPKRDSSIALFFGDALPLRRFAASTIKPSAAAAAKETTCSCNRSRGHQQQRGPSRGAQPRLNYKTEKDRRHASRRRCGGLSMQTIAERDNREGRHKKAKEPAKESETGRETQNDAAGGGETERKRQRRQKTPSGETQQTWYPIPSLVRIITKAAGRSGFSFLQQETLQQQQQVEQKEPFQTTSFTEPQKPDPQKAGDFLAPFRGSGAPRGCPSSGNNSSSSRRGQSLPLTPSRLFPFPPRQLVLGSFKRQLNEKTIRAGYEISSPPTAPTQEVSTLSTTHSCTASLSSSSRRSPRCRLTTAAKATAAEAAAKTATAAEEEAAQAPTIAWVCSLPSTYRREGTPAAAVALGQGTRGFTEVRKGTYWEEVPAKRRHRRRGDQEERQDCYATAPSSHVFARAVSPVERGAAPRAATLAVPPEALPLHSPAVAIASSATAAVSPAATAAACPKTSPMFPVATAAEVTVFPSASAAASGVNSVHVAAKEQQEEENDTSGAAKALRLIAAYRTRTCGSVRGALEPPKERKLLRIPQGPPEGELQQETPKTVPECPTPCTSSKEGETQSGINREGHPSVGMQSSSKRINEKQHHLSQRRKSFHSLACLTLKPRKCSTTPRDTGSPYTFPQLQQQQVQDMSLLESPARRVLGPLTPSEKKETSPVKALLGAMRHNAATSPGLNELLDAATGSLQHALILPPAGLAETAKAAGATTDRVSPGVRCVYLSNYPSAPVDKLFFSGTKPSPREVQLTAACLHQEVDPPQQQQPPKPQSRSSRSPSLVCLSGTCKDTSDADTSLVKDCTSEVAKVPKKATPEASATIIAAPIPHGALLVYEKDSRGSRTLAPEVLQTMYSVGCSTINKSNTVITYHPSSKQRSRSGACSDSVSPARPHQGAGPPLLSYLCKRGMDFLKISGAKNATTPAGWGAVRTLFRRLLLQQQRQRRRSYMQRARRQQGIKPQMLQHRIKAAPATSQETAPTALQSHRINSCPSAVGGPAVSAEGVPGVEMGAPASKRVFAGKGKKEATAQPREERLRQRQDTSELLPDGDTLLWTAAAKVAAARSRKRVAALPCRDPQKVPFKITPAASEEASKKETPGKSFKNYSSEAVAAACLAPDIPAAADKPAAAEPTQSPNPAADAAERKRPWLLATNWRGKFSPRLQQKGPNTARAQAAEQEKKNGLNASKGKRQQRTVNAEHFTRLYKHAFVRQQRFRELKLQREREEAERLRQEALSLRPKPPPRHNNPSHAVSKGWAVPARRYCCGGPRSPATGASQVNETSSGGPFACEANRCRAQGPLSDEEACRQPKHRQRSATFQSQLPGGGPPAAGHSGAPSRSLFKRKQLRELLLRLLTEPEETEECPCLSVGASVQQGPTNPGGRGIHSVADIKASAPASLQRERHQHRDLLLKQEQELCRTSAIWVEPLGPRLERPAHAPQQQQKQHAQKMLTARAGTSFFAAPASEPAWRWTLPAAREIAVGPLRASMGASPYSATTQLHQRAKQERAAINRPNLRKAVAETAERPPRVPGSLDHLQQPFQMTIAGADADTILTRHSLSSAAAAPQSSVGLEMQQRGWTDGRKASPFERKRATTPAPFVCGSTRNSHNIRLQQAAAEAVVRLAPGSSCRESKRFYSTGALLQRNSFPQRRQRQQEDAAAPKSHKRQDYDVNRSCGRPLRGSQAMSKEQQQRASVAAAAAAADSAILAAEAASAEAEAEAGAVRAAAAELEAFQTRTGLEMLSAYGSARGSFLCLLSAENEAVIRRRDEIAAKKRRQWQREKQRQSVERLHTTASSFDLPQHAADGTSAAGAEAAG